MSGPSVLGEIGAPVAADGRPWGLRRLDLEALGAVRERVGGRRSVLVTGPGEDGDGAGPRAVTTDGDGAGGRATATSAAAVAVGLAAAAAAAGTRTVLLECDVERPRLAGALGLRAVPGLHEYLRWEATPETVLQTLVPAGEAAGDGVAPLACICAGRPSDSPRTLLGLGSFRHLTAKLREAYELMIVLGPPLGGGDGALELVAAEAECSIAAVPERPSRRAGKALEETLARLPTAPLGAVVVNSV